MPTKRRWHSTAAINVPPVEVKVHAGMKLLRPVHHALAVAGGVAMAIFVLLLFLALFAWSYIPETLTGSVFILVALISVVIGSGVFVIMYLIRDRWVRDALGQGSILFADAKPRQKREVETDADADIDNIVRISKTLLIKLDIPPEWGIGENCLGALAQRAHQGDLTWSRRALKDIVPQERYKDFSELLLKRRFLRRGPNNSYALTQLGISMFQSMVVGGGGTRVLTIRPARQGEMGGGE